MRRGGPSCGGGTNRLGPQSPPRPGLAEVNLRRHAVLVSDADLRELERRFRESGSVEDEAAWLSARVKAGELDEDKLHLAAHLGYEAAIGDVGPPTLLETDAEVFVAWADGLSRWGKHMAALQVLRERAWPEEPPHINSGGNPNHAYLRRAFQILGGSECVEVVRDELVRWALGYSDPVRERVEARQQEGSE